MKKKFVMVVMTIFLFCGLTACWFVPKTTGNISNTPNIPDASDVTDTPGVVEPKPDSIEKLLYEKAVDLGYDGTIEEFLELLKGADGKNGENGKDGKDGQNGKDGKDGVSVVRAYINEKKELIIELSDGSASNCGEIALDFNFDNIKGEQGEKGADGKDGVSVVRAYINEEKELIIELSDGSTSNCGEIDLDFDSIKGDRGEQGENGQDGKDGLSAYEIYLKYHEEYDKSEEEWIDDLVNGRLKDDAGNGGEEEKREYTVTLIIDGNTVAEITVEEGQAVDLSEVDTEKSDYEFKGWLLSDGSFYENASITEDTVLTAKYEPKTEIGVDPIDPDDPSNEPEITFDAERSSLFDEEIITLQANHGIRITIDEENVLWLERLEISAEGGKLKFAEYYEETRLGTSEHDFTEGVFEYTGFGEDYTANGIVLEIIYISDDAESYATVTPISPLYI